MSEYLNFPPLINFKKVLNSSPEALGVYICLWQLKLDSTSHLVHVNKNQIASSFFISPTLFRNHLMSLARLDLLSFNESANGKFKIGFHED